MFTIGEFLQSEVKPALGCTEPVCIALTCAYAASLIPERIVDEIELTLSPGLYKNGHGVFLPGAPGERGVLMAAAIGAVAGDPKRDMEVLSSISKKDILGAKKLILDNKVKISIDYSRMGIYCKAKITGGDNVSEGVIAGLHNKLISLKLNGQEMVDGKDEIEGNKNHPKSSMTLDGSNIVEQIKRLPCDDLFLLLDDLTYEDLEFLKKGVEMNVTLAMEGLRGKWGYGVASTLGDGNSSKKNMQIGTEIKKFVVAAVDARMGGCDYPAMSSAGSGNNGIVATIPIWVVKSNMQIPEEDYLKAVCLSHLFTSKLKSHMGRITPVCSCGLSAGGGVAGSIAYIMTKDREISKKAVNNHLASFFGVLCDGAKPGCSIKVLIAISSVLDSIDLARRGVSISNQDGICGENLDETLKNIEMLSKNAYVDMDRQILNIISR